LFVAQASSRIFAASRNSIPNAINRTANNVLPKAVLPAERNFG